jgi:DNA adenine methylase
MYPSPFVKWAGGKTQLIAQYEPYFPTTFGRYIEPFVGGGALFFYLYRQGRLAGKRAILIDDLEELIICYQVIQNQVETLLKELKTHEHGKLDSDYFYEVRDWDRQPGYAQRSDVQRAARFIFLNHTCYNGLYRVNRRGQFNVPMGRHRNPTIRNVQNLRAVGDALQDVSLFVDDFERCLEIARPGDLVYLDPPYQPLPDTASFTSYTSADFGAGDQQRLAVLFRELDHRGCQVMLSNSSTDLIRELYDGYEQIPVRAARAISSRGDGRGAIPELLVVNRYERL